MAMRACKECGTQISTKAEVCPKCGIRLRPKPGGCAQALGGLISLFVFGGIALMLLSGGSGTDAPATKAEALEKLRSECSSQSASMPDADSQQSFYNNCVSTGTKVIESRIPN